MGPSTVWHNKGLNPHRLFLILVFLVSKAQSIQLSMKNFSTSDIIAAYPNYSSACQTSNVASAATQQDLRYFILFL